MSKLEIIKNQGKVVDWVIDEEQVGFDVYDISENYANLSVTDGLTISDFFDLVAEDFPILTDVFLMTQDDEIQVDFITSIGIYRRDDRFSIAFMFNEATVVDEILGYPAIQVIRYLELVAKTKENTEILIPFEFDEGALFYIGIIGEMNPDIKSLFNDCQSKLVSLVQETIEYLDSLERAIKSRKFILKIPNEIKVPLSQYLMYFSSYLKKSKGVNVKIIVDEVTEGLELRFQEIGNTDIEHIKEWMLEFISYIKDTSGEISIVFEKDSSDKEKQLLIISLKQQVSHLRNSLDIINLENQFLKEHNDFFKHLLLNISSQKIQVSTIVTNEMYNYVDKIIHESDLLTNNDRELIRLIYENTDSEKEREDLVNNLKIIKDPNASKATKEKSKSVFRKFIESGLTEATKQLFKRLIDIGIDSLT